MYSLLLLLINDVQSKPEGNMFTLSGLHLRYFQAFSQTFYVITSKNGDQTPSSLKNIIRCLNERPHHIE